MKVLPCTMFEMSDMSQFVQDKRTVFCPKCGEECERELVANDEDRRYALCCLILWRCPNCQTSVSEISRWIPETDKEYRTFYLQIGSLEQ